jgi:uncharacterized protein (TIGR02466 family)
MQLIQGAGVVNLFPTPVFTYDLPNCEALNAPLLSAVAKLREIDPGQQRSNVHGWHSSTPHLPKLPEFAPVIKQTLEVLKGAVEGMGYQNMGLVLANSWIVVNPKGASNAEHCHPRAFISGAYYIQVSSEGLAPLVFHDPREVKVFSEPVGKHQETMYTVDQVGVQARAGRLVLFPSWLRHSVLPNPSETERIVFSFNFVPVPPNALTGCSSQEG